MCQAVRLVDAETGRESTVGGTYVTCRHLVCAGSQAERGLTTSGGVNSRRRDNSRERLYPAPSVTINKLEAIKMPV